MWQKGKRPGDSSGLREGSGTFPSEMLKVGNPVEGAARQEDTGM